MMNYIKKSVLLQPQNDRGVAQLASALAWGARGRKFESSHPDYFTVMVIIFERGFRVTLFFLF